MRSRRAHQNAGRTGNPRLDGGERANHRRLLQHCRINALEVHQLLGTRLEGLEQLAGRLTTLRQQMQHLQRGNQPVARGAERGQHDMAGGFPA